MAWKSLEVGGEFHPSELVSPSFDIGHIGWCIFWHLDEEWVHSSLPVEFWRQSFLLQSGLHRVHHDKRKSGWYFKGKYILQVWLPKRISHRSSKFTSNLIEDLLAHHKINHITSTPYHPQENGQVEVTNRALEEILTKVLSSSRKYWENHLVEATRAYNTTWKTTTSFTPYELVYGKKALLSIEFEYNTLRLEAQLDLDLSHAQ